jgi:hypothetical protein
VASSGASVWSAVRLWRPAFEREPHRVGDLEAERNHDDRHEPPREVTEDACDNPDAECTDPEGDAQSFAVRHGEQIAMWH